MRIEGLRADGAQLLLLGSGLAVIMRGDRVSTTVDEDVARKLGPWGPADNGLEQRRAAERQVDRCRVTPIHLMGAMPAAADSPASKGEPAATAEELKAKASEHQAAAWGEDNDIDKLKEDADNEAKEALKQSASAKTAADHRAAADALEAAAASQAAVAKLQEGPAATPAPGTPEFDAYVAAEVARRVSEAQATPAPVSA